MQRPKVVSLVPAGDAAIPDPVSGYSTREAAGLLGVAESRVRAWVRAGFLDPDRGPRGEVELSFQDLVLLRTAKQLAAARIPGRRIRAALGKLREQLPAGRPLSAIRIVAQGNRLVARDGKALWIPESGQALFDFEVSDWAHRARETAPLARRAAGIADTVRDRREELDAEDWYQLGCELEATAPDEALDAYRRALDLDPEHADAHLNAGRLLHEEGETAEAEAHYRRALAARPDDATAAFDLGVALEDLGRLEEAADAYEAALAADGRYADAHFNLAGICEKLGRRATAFQHLAAYKSLVQGRRS